MSTFNNCNWYIHIDFIIFCVTCVASSIYQLSISSLCWTFQSFLHISTPPHLRFLSCLAAKLVTYCKWCESNYWILLLRVRSELPFVIVVETPQRAIDRLHSLSTQFSQQLSKFGMKLDHFLKQLIMELIFQHEICSRWTRLAFLECPPETTRKTET